MAERRFFRAKVIGTEKLNPYTVVMRIEGGMDFEAGQFVMLSYDEHILARPFSVFRSFKDRFEVLFKIFGEWTAKLTSKSHVNVLGPLGVGFRRAMEGKGVRNPKKILVVAGGVGIASVFAVLTQFEGEKTVVFGGASSPDIILRDEIEKHAKLFITTVDGSLGKRGFVTDVLDDVLRKRFDVAFACGPTPMLKALAKFWRERELEVPMFFAVEERMACGVGICFSCAIKTRGGLSLACQHGPVFFWDDVIF